MWNVAIFNWQHLLCCNHFFQTFDYSNHSSSEPGSARNSDASSITVNLTRIGFSKSSCDIAKELLESSVENIDEESNTESNYDGNHMAKPIRPFSLTKEGTVKVKQLLYKIHDSKLCRVCMDEPASAVFCPCGHLVSCYSCALACMKCPLCRREVAYVQYVYNSGLWREKKVTGIVDQKLWKASLRTVTCSLKLIISGNKSLCSFQGDVYTLFDFSTWGVQWTPLAQQSHIYICSCRYVYQTKYICINYIFNNLNEK